MINHKHKFIFVHIPKTGGTSIEQVFEDQHLDENYHNTRDHINKHAPLNHYIHPSTKDYFKFTFVRDPWDRMYSHYNFFKYRNFDTKGSFNNFVKYFSNYKNNKGWERNDFLPMVDFISTNSEINVDFIGNFNTLQEDFDIICDKIKIPRRKLLHTNYVKKDKNYKKYYDEETKQIITERYKKDIEFFNYTF